MKIPKKSATRMGIEIINTPQQTKRRKAANTDKRQGRNRLFDELCKAHGLPIPVKEYRFDEVRKWRFDYLFDGWLALESQGGLFTGGRHVRGAALLGEYEKLNEAAIQGYTVLFCTPADIDSGAACALVKRAIFG